jgi:hypothetical protein
VSVAPPSTTIGIGATQQLTATIKDASGKAIAGAAVAWTSSAQAIATVNAGGLVSAVAAGSVTITAASGGKTGTASLTVMAAPPPATVASVAVVPTPITLAVGGSQGLTATVKDASGNVMQGQAVTWTTANAAVANVGANGMVGAVASGATTITAKAGGKAGNATVTVTNAPPPPPPPSGGTPSVLEDFSTYTSTANLLADPRGLYRLGEDVDTPDIKLDPTVGFGGSTQSMRYDFPDRTNDPNRCSDQTRTRWLRVVPQSDASVTHLWAEIYYKFSNGFSIYAPGSWSCTSGPAYKLLFGAVSAMDATHQNSRFQIVAGQGDFDLGWPDLEDAVSLRSTNPGYPGTTYPGTLASGAQAIVAVPGILQPNATGLFDGNWHQIRIEWKVSSGLNVADGVARYWFDGVLGFDSEAYGKPLIINRGGIYAIPLGANMNQGPGKPQSLWYGKVSIYTTNPGW